MNAMFTPSLWTRKRLRHIRQNEQAECGLACLTMVANYYGLDTDLATLRRRFPPSTHGANLRHIIEVAGRLALSGRAVKLPLEDISRLSFPAILHWDLNHFVVASEMRRDQVLISDPAGGSVWMPLSKVSDHFTGVALELRPEIDFRPIHERQQLKLSGLWSNLSGLKRALVQTLLLTVVLQLYTLSSPYLLQLSIDQVIPQLDESLLFILGAGFGLFTIFYAASMLLRSFVLLSAGTWLSYGLATNVASRMLRLPISWFQRRHVGDILSRFQSVSPIRKYLVEGALAVVLDGILALSVLTMMLFYSVTLSLIAVAAFMIYGLVRYISYGAEKIAQEDAITSLAQEQSVMIESLRGIVTLRLYNRETVRLAAWQARLNDAMNASVRLGSISSKQKAANTLIFGLENVLTICVAVSSAISGGFSTGMIVAFLAYKIQFIERSISVVDQFVEFRMLSLHLDRLSDIALTDEDECFQNKAVGFGGQVAGKIELRDIHFRYSESDPYILKGVNMVVQPGERAVITGPSGGGKTTLIKILLGLLSPDRGEILVDDVPLNQMGIRNFQKVIGAVLQDDHLFSGTLTDNIALFDDAPDMDQVFRVSELAAIHGDILRMPMHYDTLIGDMGGSLSGGQKQRLLLARALYRGPRILVMDEGTAHLDAEREKQVAKSIKDLGITSVSVAHRRESIEAAEKIFVCENGVITGVA